MLIKGIKGYSFIETTGAVDYWRLSNKDFRGVLKILFF